MVAGNFKITSGALAVGGGINPSGTPGRIDASNDIVAFSTSDRRLKDNIKTIDNSLQKLLLLNGVEYDWKADSMNIHGYEGHDVGVIAQEVNSVLPEAIRINETGYLSVRMEKIIPLLIESIKEQQRQIDELNNKINNSKNF